MNTIDLDLDYSGQPFPCVDLDPDADLDLDLCLEMFFHIQIQLSNRVKSNTDLNQILGAKLKTDRKNERKVRRKKSG